MTTPRPSPTLGDHAGSDPIVWSAVRAGAWTGLPGLAFGAVAGLIRSSSPALFAAASGVQWFALGSLYWGTRETVIRERYGPDISPFDRITASTIAGGVAGGTVGLVTRGRANVLPGILMFSVAGALGQVLYNRLDAQHSAAQLDSAPQSTILQRIAHSRYLPVKVLPDDEYRKMLEEKLLRIDAEISILDESIAQMKSSKDANEDTES